MLDVLNHFNNKNMKYEILSSICIKKLEQKVNDKINDGYMPLGSITIRNIGKAFKSNCDETITEIEYYQPMLKIEDMKETTINIFNKSCILNFK